MIEASRTSTNCVPASSPRQSIYLQFGSRSALLLALVEHVDREEGLGDLVARIQAAPSALEELDRLVALNVGYEPRIRAVVLAHDAARRGDPDLEAAWQDRMRRRRGLCAHVVGRLSEEGLLAAGLRERDAVDLAWALLGSRLHEDLVVERGWSRRRYERHLRALLRSALTGAAAA
jgi:AcrR family transcriptional regulator